MKSPYRISLDGRPYTSWPRLLKDLYPEALIKVQPPEDAEGRSHPWIFSVVTETATPKRLSHRTPEWPQVMELMTKEFPGKES